MGVMKERTLSMDNDVDSIYESSSLSFSSSASNRVKRYLKEHDIPESHIDKHFTFKSPKKSVKSRKHKKHNLLPSASHSLIHFNVSSSETSSTSDDEIAVATRLSKHHWWTRMTIQCACCGVMIIEFGWTIVECLIIPYLFLSSAPYFCISWILFFIPLIDSWLEPALYIWFNKFIYKHHNYYYAQLMLILFTLLFLFGFFVIPHSNVVTGTLFDVQTKGYIRMFMPILGFTIMNLSLGYLLIPLRFIMNDAIAKISSKKFFSLRKKTIADIYNNKNLQYLSKKAEKNYISSFDALATQIYNINEYNHYLQYSQRSISIYQVCGRCFGYLFASIDWFSFEFINTEWMYAHQYGHIELCFSFTCAMTMCGLLIVTLFTIYVHAYAMKKIQKKKKNFYLLLNSIKRKKYIPAPTAMVKSTSVSMSTTLSLFRKHRSLIVHQNDSLEYLVPTLQSKISFDLTRICNINPRTRCCYFIIDGIQLHEESVHIYMDWRLNQKLSQNISSNQLNSNEGCVIGWNMVSLTDGCESTSLFGLKSDDTQLLSMPFELGIFWWMTFFGWLQVISFLYFFTIFVAQELSPCSMQNIYNSGLDLSQQKDFINSVRYACLIMMFNAIGAGMIQLFIIERVLSLNHCKTLLIGSEFGISITSILFFFTHSEYHPSFVILLVTVLGFLTQLHYNLPYLLIEYKMIAIRHKETRRQYRTLSYYCSLIDNVANIDNIDMTPFDSFKNSNKLMQIEQLKQRILQRYNLSFFFALFAVSVFNGMFVFHSQSDTKQCIRELDQDTEPNTFNHDFITTTNEATPSWKLSSNPHFVFCIVLWGLGALIAHSFLFSLYLFYRQCWKPYKKRKKQKKHQQQKEFDEWKLKRAENTAYYTNIQSLKEKKIKSFIRDKSKTINHNLNIFKRFNKNRPIQRASACTLKLFELKKDLRYKYKYRLNIDQHEMSTKTTSTESYLEYSTYSPQNKASPLTSPIIYPIINDQHHGYLNGDDELNDNDNGTEHISPTMLVHEITKYSNQRHVHIKLPSTNNQSNALLFNKNRQKYGTFLD